MKNYQFKWQHLTGGVDIQYFWERGKTLYGGTWHFIGGLDNPVETMLYYLTLISF